MHWEVMREAPWCIFLTNQQGYDVPIERLTIAWHRPPNLGNLLSYRKLENRTGLNLSSFIKTWDKYAPNFFSRGGRLWRPALCSKKYYGSALWMIPSICERGQMGYFFKRKAFTPFSFLNPFFFYCYNLLPCHDFGLICCIAYQKPSVASIGPLLLLHPQNLCSCLKH